MKRGAQLITGEKWTIEDENMTCWVDQKIKRGGAINDRRKVVNSVLECEVLAERTHTHTHNNTKGSFKKKKIGWT